MSSDSKKILKVNEFLELVQKHLDVLGDFVIEGEISEIKAYNTWLYITIKDDAFFVKVWGSTFKLSNWESLIEGTKVHVFGNPSLYAKRGDFQITALRILPAREGALQLAFEQLKNKLESEGLFRPERKRSIPDFPEHIGLITAKDSQAYKDFIKVLRERMGGIEISFYPVTVQGKGSVESIVQALNHFNNHLPEVDVLVICRGGDPLKTYQVSTTSRWLGQSTPVMHQS